MKKEMLLYVAWAIAVGGTVGSLFFSQIMHLPPCSLCWYQRIFMYPLVILLAMGIFRKDKNISLYTLPLAVLGLLTAIYHNLLYYRFIPESTAPCLQGISCTTRQIEFLGFITIPLLSLGAFAIVSLLLFLHTRNK